MLTDATIRAAKPCDTAYKLSDSGQLYLQVTPSGGRHWRMNYSFGRNAAGKPKQKTLSFGSYPAVTLADARAKRDEAKRLLAHKRDPAVAQRENDDAASAAETRTFQNVAEEWFEAQSGWSLDRRRDWSATRRRKPNHKHASDWIVDTDGRWTVVHANDVISSLERDVFPFVGQRPISDLRPAELTELLKAIQKRGSLETAHRIRQRISAVFQYGAIQGYCPSDIASLLGKLLKPVPRARHQPAITDGLADQHQRLAAIRELIRQCEIERCRAETKFANRLIALTAVRPGALAGARWSEFHELDGDTPTWIIPSERMKVALSQKGDSSFDHPVPLARQAVEVLRALYRLTGKGDLCFPSVRNFRKQISENTIRSLLIRAGYYQRHVPHGYRAAFSTFMNERAKELGRPGDREVIDLMLAHKPRLHHDRNQQSAISASERAYNRAAYMPLRRELAQAWADLILEGASPPAELIGEPMRWVHNGPKRPVVLANSAAP